LPDYELLELVLFGAIPRRDVKPLAKSLLERFGSFAEVKSIAPAMRECVALGLLIITQHGKAGNAEFRSPNLFLLPYLEPNTAGQKWRQMTTIEAAQTIAEIARKPPKKQNPSGGLHHVSGVQTTTENAVFRGGNHHRNTRGGNHHYYLDASHCSAPGAGVADATGHRPRFLERSTPTLTEVTVTPAEYAALSRLPDVPLIHVRRPLASRCRAPASRRPPALISKGSQL
jgi:hypothetical protein